MITSNFMAITWFAFLLAYIVFRTSNLLDFVQVFAGMKDGNYQQRANVKSALTIDGYLGIFKTAVLPHFPE